MHGIFSSVLHVGLAAVGGFFLICIIIGLLFRIIIKLLIFAIIVGAIVIGLLVKYDHHLTWALTGQS